MTDDFNGDNAQLVSCIESLISLDADGALVPHGLGGHARGLLAAAASRLALSTNAGEAAPVANAAGEAFNNMFHKCRAEVSMDWWQRIWGMAVRWAWENPQSDAQPTLRSALNAMLTQFGMDEDEWNKPTFDQARRALVHPPAAVHGQSARTEHSPTCPHFCAACATPPAAIPAAPSEAFTAAYMAACKGRAPDHNEIGLHYFRAGAALAQPAPVQQEAVEACDHEWIPLRNEKITSGEICAKLCGATRREGDSQ